MQYLFRFLAPTLIAVISYLATDLRFGFYYALRYDREAIVNGEFWRLLTGNLTHAGVGHWLVNMFGLWLLWLIYVANRKMQHIMLLALLVTALGTCIGIFLLEPQLKFYVGLSGALHGFFVAGIIITFKTEAKIQSILAILLFGKIVYEQIFGSLPGSEQVTGAPVIVNSHLFGAVIGLFFGSLIMLLKSRSIHARH